MPDAEIGATLREARMRARIDVSEVEAQTKIRAKYLRALENEEWDLLPGPTFVKSFLKTYAQALGLDDKALVEEYRQFYERPNEADRAEIGQQPIVHARSKKSTRERGGGRPKVRAPRGGGGGPSPLYVVAIGAVSLIVVLLIVGLLTSGSSNNSPPSTAATRSTSKPGRTGGSAAHGGTAPAASAGLVALSIHPTGPVYVCLISATGAKLVPGVILDPNPTHPSAQPTYHSHRFTLVLGNASAHLFIDGSLRTVPPSSNAIGYTITKTGGRHTLPAGQLPTCR